MEKKVIVIGKNYSNTLGVVRALGSAGYSVDVIFVYFYKSVLPIVSKSKYIDRFYAIKDKDDNQILSLLETYSNGNKIPLIPTDDYSVSLIDANKDKLERWFYTPHVKSGAKYSVSELMVKKVQNDIALLCGLKVIPSWYIDLVGNKEFTIPSDIVFPCFVKPLVSSQGTKYEITTCHDIKELEITLEKLQQARTNRTILIQKFITIVEEYSMPGISTEDNVFFPAVLKKVETGQRARGVTLVGKILNPEVETSTVSKVIDFAKELNYVGLIDIEFFKDADGETYYCETNFRSSGVLYSIIKAGCNLPSMIVQYLQTGVFQKQDIEYGKLFFNDKARLEDYMFGHISLPHYMTIGRKCDYSLLNDKKDFIPQVEFFFYSVKSITKRIVKNILKMK